MKIGLDSWILLPYDLELLKLIWSKVIGIINPQ